MKKIDVHVHLGKVLYDKPGLSVKYVLLWMDSLEIEKACIMAVENPEEVDYYVPSERVLRACRQHSDRLIPFCNVDPRRGHPPTWDPYPIIAHYVDRGAKGFGEMLAGLKIDDPRQMKLFDACNRLKLPIMIHIDGYRNIDDIGLPRFEKVIQTFPEAKFIAHALHWWSEISGDVTEADKNDYPKRPITTGGRVDVLLQKYDNLYADLSAESGRNALTRDPAFAPGFLERNQDKLLFGTDLCYKGLEIKLHHTLNSMDVSTEILSKIYYLNSQKLFEL